MCEVERGGVGGEGGSPSPQGVWVAAVCRGGVAVGSVWLKDSEGLSDFNMYLLGRVAQRLAGLRMPWVLGGDWNPTPELLTKSGFLGITDDIFFNNTD